MDPKLVLEVAVAKLVSQNEPQAKIAKMLGISQAYVSRLRTGNNHLITSPVEFEISHSIPKNVRSELMAEVGKRLGTEAAREFLIALSPYKSFFQMDVIYGDDRLVHEGDDWSEQGFHERVAATISKLIGRSRRVGVAWDLGIKPPNDYIPNFTQRNFSKENEPIQFVPLCGVTADIEDSLVKSSTVIAMDYYRLVNKGYPRGYSDHYNLNCIPLIHPEPKGTFWNKMYDRGGIPSSNEVVEYLKSAFPDYNRIFGHLKGEEKNALVYQLDMIFTGLGDNKNNARSLLEMLYPNCEEIPGYKFQNRSITKEELCESWIVGDIAGVLLPVPGVEESELVTRDLNDRLATLRAEHLTNCCERARDLAPTEKKASRKSLDKRESFEYSPPGVVAICDGVERAPALQQAIRLGYVSRAIVSEDLAKYFSEIPRHAEP